MAMKTFKGMFQREAASEHADRVPEPDEQCFACGAALAESRMYERYRVCHACEYHYHLKARERAALVLDLGSFHEDDRGVTAIDPLSFGGTRSYRSRIIAEQRRTKMTESALTGTGTVFDRDVVFAALDFSFLGGSVGVASGERLARAFEKATSRGCAIVTMCSTSGTRMQEGLLALMQMPRVIAAARRHSRAGLPHITVLSNPATGSAMAGFVQLADYVVAEPGALVGYSALRTLRQTAAQQLPPDAHTSESQLEHGLIDTIVPRAQLRDSLGMVLDLLMNDYRLTAPRGRRAHKSTHTHRGAWQLVQLSRHENRPNAEELIAHMTTSFVELRGDRTGYDDRSVLTGLASISGEAVVVIGQNRPHSTERADDGWISASGFRKATRALQLAEKFNLPAVTLIDTAGAYPSLENEEGGLGTAIATCMATMLETPVPTIAVITGEGNSEAAAAMAAADRVLMLDNAVYTVMPPEEAAARVLMGSGDRPEEMAERLRLTSHDLLKLGMIDETIPEPGEGAHTNHVEASLLVRRGIVRALTDIRGTKPAKRLAQRYERYRNVGSARTSVRGRLERQLAHFVDRAERLLDWGRRRSGTKRTTAADSHDIPV